MIALLLVLLAVMDAACAGYRSAAGRSALIDKGRYYRRALLRGALWGIGAVAIAAAAVCLLLMLSPDSHMLYASMEHTAWRMLQVYLPYALVLGVAFALRLPPMVDLRSASSVLIFGPLTLARPFVAVGGALWGLWSVNRVEIWLFSAFVLAMMFLLERGLERSYVGQGLD